MFAETNILKKSSIYSYGTARLDIHMCLLITCLYLVYNYNFNKRLIYKWINILLLHKVFNMFFYTDFNISKNFTHYPLYLLLLLLKIFILL